MTQLHSHHVDINDVNILDREKNWFEHGVNEVAWVRTYNPSINCNGDTRITLSHSLGRSIDTLRSFSPCSKTSGSKK